MELNWILKKFNALTAAELYAVLQLRNEVFVVEQNCAYQDADGVDLQSLHFMGWDGAILAAYTRIIPPGIIFEQASIGRVVTSPKYRGLGTGRQLMELSISNTFSQFNCTQIIICAQLYLKKFYESLGFVQCSKTYLEDNIPHIKMLMLK
jgi:ElaA protein